jgi:hypothetical protein
MVIRRLETLARQSLRVLARLLQWQLSMRPFMGTSKAGFFASALAITALVPLSVARADCTTASPPTCSGKVQSLWVHNDFVRVE